MQKVNFSTAKKQLRLRRFKYKSVTYVADAEFIADEAWLSELWKKNRYTAIVQYVYLGAKKLKMQYQLHARCFTPKSAGMFIKRKLQERTALQGKDMALPGMALCHLQLILQWKAVTK